VRMSERHWGFASWQHDATATRSEAQQSKSEKEVKKSTARKKKT